jgi:hypothetical protein
MRFSWRSVRPEKWRSSLWHASESHPGVYFELARMSLARRGALLAELHQSIQDLRYQEAGESPLDALQAGRLRIVVESTYLKWGLIRIANLRIDGAVAGPELLVEKGPEDLCHEIAAQVRAQCGLAEAERKN